MRFYLVALCFVGACTEAKAPSEPTPPVPPTRSAPAPKGKVVKKATPKPVAQKRDHVDLAGKRIDAPPGFHLELSQNPPLEKLSAIGDKARCDFGILLNHSSDEELKNLDRAMRSAYTGKLKTKVRREVEGIPFDGMTFQGVPDLGRVQVLSAKVGADLLAVSLAGSERDVGPCEGVFNEIVRTLK